ncbi:nitroreductase family deazaflavin-dependent oxidoreductase [Amycolatopsis rhizosphaerae]|uniref:Nitroreductase family deazaflavin-dependent oxidoreductase n=1 Tax=Amycolatopsis rhizosphaerae TaxID=2053003 RepID=A0A558BQD7_9PSEU|nr:nitroreductase family deazaflavin-dependent oxidoreductase [Amycolatopsis rhizosphaerae]TVT38730.1 nitroreductase family deazaflavin-dependent oxidoreductase [Amycolatopsis rhizosphaerae]
MRLVDHAPRGLLRAFFRAPIALYRTGLGALFGHRLLYLVHKGRKSGLRRETVLEVVAYDPRQPEAVVVSAWGENSDWYRNITATPALELRIGRQHWTRPRHRLLELDETVRTLRAYRVRHPRAWRRLAPVMGIPLDPAAASAHDALTRLRVVAFTPAG